MDNLVPQHYMNIKDSFKKFLKARHNIDLPDYSIKSLSRVPSFAELLEAYQTGALQAYVKFEGRSEENIKLPIEGWFSENNPFPERLFYTSAVETDASEHWKKFIGLCPFVSVRALDNWLELILSEPYKFDVGSEKWSIYDCIIWIKTNGTGILKDEKYDKAAAMLFSKLKSGEIICEGDNQNGDTKNTPSQDWGNVRLSNENDLFLYGCNDSQVDSDIFIPHEGSLVLEGSVIDEPKWTRLVVQQCDIKKHWPYVQVQDNPKGKRGRGKGVGAHDYSEVAALAKAGIQNGAYRNPNNAGDILAPEWQNKVGAISQASFKTGLAKALKEH